MSFSVLIWVVIKGISSTVVAGNYCVFYNKLHFRTFLPRRKVHGQKDYSEAVSGIPVSEKMRNKVELPFLGNYSLRTLIFQAAIYQRSVWTKGRWQNRLQSKNDYGPTKIIAEWTRSNLLVSSGRRLWKNTNSELGRQPRKPCSFCLCSD